MGFKRFFFKRLIQSIVTWIFVLILNFLIFYKPSSTARSLTIPVQVIKYFHFVFIERFGPYMGYGPEAAQPILDYVFSISVNSFILLALSLTIAVTLGVILGTLASYKQGGKIDAVLSVAALTPFAFPVWWTAIVLLIYLYPTFPAFGWHSREWYFFINPWSNIFKFIPDFLNHLVLPLATFILAFTGIYFIVTRNSLRNVYTQDYMTTAKAKGVSPRKIMFKHALKNALIPVISTIALTPPILVLGVVMTEFIFTRGGLGMILLDTAMDPVTRYRNPPSPLLQAVFIVFATAIIILHFVVDVSLSILDPRIRMERESKVSQPFYSKVSEFMKKFMRGKSGKFRFRLRRFDGKVITGGFSQPFHRKVLSFMKKFMKGYSGKFGFGVILFFVIAGLVVPYLPLPNPSHFDLSVPKSQPPSLDHLLGTDNKRRDVLAMIFWGAPASLIEGLGAVAIALTIGCFVGLFSGYYSDGLIGYLLDRITDLFLAIPIIVIIIYFPMRVSVFKPMLAVGLTTWAVTAKLVRVQVISAKDKPFIEASRASGAGDIHILFRRLLPECIPAVASSMLFVVVTALAMQSCLDYLGLDRRIWSQMEKVTLEPYMSWGSILSYRASDFIGSEMWWLIFPPAICIALLALALIAIGNKLIEIVNPTLTSR